MISGPFYNEITAKNPSKSMFLKKCGPFENFFWGVYDPHDPPPPCIHTDDMQTGKVVISSSHHTGKIISKN